jgi:hypothetical protein
MQTKGRIMADIVLNVIAGGRTFVTDVLMKGENAEKVFMHYADVRMHREDYTECRKRVKDTDPRARRAYFRATVLEVIR